MVFHDSLPPLVAYAFDALLDRMDTRGAGLDAAQRDAQRRCGQWLAVRRLKLGLTTEMVAQRTGLDPQHLLLAEAGLAAPPLAADECWYRLCLVLELDHDFEWVGAVLHSALGLADSEWAAVLAQVNDDLWNAIESWPLWESLGYVPPQQLPEEAFLVLRALVKGRMDVSGIRDWLAHNYTGELVLGVATVQLLLRDLIDSGMVKPSAHPRSPIARPVGETYELSRQGREVVEFKERIRPLEEQEQQLAREKQALREREEEVRRKEAQLRERNRHLQHDVLFPPLRLL